ncbi:hypothetical protein BST97_14360 [Nonlabens spongiae]|uniref:Uncharacterized protein n=1 Tax=Nonlabens spongiae TaxID=331648 RepID=A0A1W6MNC1_9FLAO|nr:hypothetical protein [Nonlabens spongiae]ARN79077.1 hypothetical protein BST97_14360 [Nonlabens spongiae]
MNELTLQVALYRDNLITSNYELPIKNGAQVEAIPYAYKDKKGKQVFYLSSEAAAIKLGEDEAQSDAELYKMVW